mmetsp:Transcript_31700/g.75601  ORF Transcript_31700/g.75601 Transcript_31700/m.75601 type:complete len:209 (+) Transcript_31700:500-1126(+)
MFLRRIPELLGARNRGASRAKCLDKGPSEDLGPKPTDPERDHGPRRRLHDAQGWSEPRVGIRRHATVRQVWRKDEARGLHACRLEEPLLHVLCDAHARRLFDDPSNQSKSHAPVVKVAPWFENQGLTTFHGHHLPEVARAGCKARQDAHQPPRFCRAPGSRRVTGWTIVVGEATGMSKAVLQTECLLGFLKLALILHIEILRPLRHQR